MSLYAGIVSYNPDIERLRENVASVSRQVPYVVVFDNGSCNIFEIEQLLSSFCNVILIKSERNMGIAAALNRLMEWGNQRQYQWMLSLDQDSVCDSSFVSQMCEYLDAEAKAGIVAPVIVDRNVGVIGHHAESSYSLVRTCITSGSFTRIEAWKSIGGYDEYMFIDSVDFEFCYRMRKKGFSIVQVNDVRLLHELGNSRKRRLLFFHVNVTGHSAFRKYYIARNNVYYPLKHHLLLRFIRGNIRNMILVLDIILYEDDKKQKIHSVMAGWKDSFGRGGGRNGC